MIKVYNLFVILTFLHFTVKGQSDTSLLFQAVDSAAIISIDSLGDSLVLRGAALFVVSKDSIDVPVNYGADEKVIFDYQAKVIYLYENAFVHYKLMKIHAAYIQIDLNTNIATAKPLFDSIGRRRGIPKFEEGVQDFSAQIITYNFQTKKGSIKEIVSQEDDLYIHGRQTKFISKQNEETGGEDIVYNQHAIITTCDHEIPHYGIYSKKQKIIPNKMVIVGPSNLVIQNVPIPIWLPFGFFPISKDRRSGVILPNRYGYDLTRGYYFSEFGYYIPISNYLDLKLTGDIYFRGSYRLAASTNYKKRYKYRGAFSINFRNDKEELPNTYKTAKNTSMAIDLNHQQEPGSHPYQNFGGRIHFETGRYSRNNYADPRITQTNTINSNLDYTRNFPNSPFSLSTSFRHDQNLNTRIMNVTFPNLSINMSSITPFKNSNRKSAQEKWYDRITVSYNSIFNSQISTYDSLIFTQQALDTLRYGAQHKVNVNATFKLLKYINITPRINYDEEWFFVTQKLILDDTIIESSLGVDSIFGVERRTTEKGFASFRRATAGVNLSTQLFGLIPSSSGWFRGLRHQITPSVSLDFSPDYHKNPFNYFDSVDTDLRPEKNIRKEYIRFTEGVFGSPSVSAENFNINFSASNRLELKYYSKKDSTAKRIPIIESLSFFGNYNVFRDSFNLSTIGVSGNTRLFKGYTTLSYGLSFDPYGRVQDSTIERRIKQYALQSNKTLGYITSSYMNISNGISYEQLQSLISGNAVQAQGPQGNFQDLFQSFRLSHNLQINHRRLEANGKDTITIGVHSVSIDGNIPLTKNWNIRIGNISYNIQSNEFTLPTFGFERSLHCWVMRFDWSPQYGSYFFTLGVKPGSLDFIKLPSSSGNRQF